MMIQAAEKTPPTIDIEVAGQALFGSQWQSALSRALGISDRHIRRLASGEAKVKQSIALELVTLCLNRIRELEGAVESLKEEGTEILQLVFVNYVDVSNQAIVKNVFNRFHGRNCHLLDVDENRVIVSFPKPSSSFVEEFRNSLAMLGIDIIY